MPVDSTADLAPETRDVVEEYLARVEAGFCGVAPRDAEEALLELRAHFLDALDAGSGPERARTLAAELGEPDEYAMALCEALSADDGVARGERDGTEPMGRFLGMPYDAAAPTPERVGSRMWSPDDPRIFMPRLLGLGWTINFGAVAVRLGLIEPDAEDQPFANVPEAWLWAALAVPLTITAAMLVTVSIVGGSLPAELPVHWGVDGSPDGFASARTALGVPLAAALLSSGYALWVFSARKSSTARAVSSAFAALFAVVSGCIFAASLAGGAGVTPGWWWPIAMIAACMAVPFVMLVVLARLGRATEMRRDLDEARSDAGTQKGRV